jgi:hypothetical protein
MSCSTLGALGVTWAEVTVLVGTKSSALEEGRLSDGR